MSKQEQASEPANGYVQLDNQEEKRFFWLRASKDFYNSFQMQMLKKKAESEGNYTGAHVAHVYERALVEALPTSGIIDAGDGTTTASEFLSITTGEDLTAVQFVIDFCLEKNIAEAIGERGICFFYPDGSVGSESTSAKRQRRSREREKNGEVLIPCLDGNVTVTVDQFRDMFALHDIPRENRLNVLKRFRQEQYENNGRKQVHKGELQACFLDFLMRKKDRL